MRLVRKWEPQGLLPRSLRGLWAGLREPGIWWGPRLPSQLHSLPPSSPQHLSWLGSPACLVSLSLSHAHTPSAHAHSECNRNLNGKGSLI